LPDGQVGERARVERERVLDQPDQLGVVKVEAEVLVELTDGRQVVVERLLDMTPVVCISAGLRCSARWGKEKGKQK